MSKEKTAIKGTPRTANRPVKDQPESEAGFAIAPSSYKFIVIGFAVVILGFILMAGGGSDDPTVFNPEVFSFRRITLAPLVVLAGFVGIGWAIMRRPAGEDEPK